MTFQPEAHQELTIDGVTYAVAEHPAAHGMPYGQEGRQAVVYSLNSTQRNSRRALKAFKPRFRVPAMVGLAKRLALFADLPGLQVCRRTVLTPQHHAGLLREHPDLLYAVLMPWVEGPTWMEVVLERHDMSPDKSLELARSLAIVLAGMEQEGLAHCDLSGPNVLIPALAPPFSQHDVSQSDVALVDVEQMYGPDLKKPEVVPGGSPGYAHKTAPEAMWETDADRLAGAVLLAEMLTWCDASVRAASWGESYFDPTEMQRESERASVLTTALRDHWGDSLLQVFDRAWHSDTLSDCPTFGEWLVVLPETVGTASRPVQARVPTADDIKAAIDAADAGPVDPIVRDLMSQAEELQSAGDTVAAAALYREARSLSVEGSRLAGELTLLIADLDRRQGGDAYAAGVQPAGSQPEPDSDVPVLPIVGELMSQASKLEDNGNLKEALATYREALSVAPLRSRVGQELELIVQAIEARMAAEPASVMAPGEAAVPPLPEAEEISESLPLSAVATPPLPTEPTAEHAGQAEAPPTTDPILGELISEAQGLESAGNLKEALATYREALSLVPGNGGEAAGFKAHLNDLESRIRDLEFAPPPPEQIIERQEHVSQPPTLPQEAAPLPQEPAPAKVALDPIVGELMAQAREQEDGGQSEAALATYREAQSLVPAESEFGQELELIVRDLEKDLPQTRRDMTTRSRSEDYAPAAPPPPPPSAPGSSLGDMLAATPEPVRRQAPPSSLPGGEDVTLLEPAPVASGITGDALDSIFTMGVAAYKRGDFAQAGQLLREVVKRKPGYERDGQLASRLLMDTERQIEQAEKGKGKAKGRGKEQKPAAKSAPVPVTPSQAKPAPTQEWMPAAASLDTTSPVPAPQQNVTAVRTAGARSAGIPVWVPVAAVVALLALGISGFLILRGGGSSSNSGATATAQAAAMAGQTGTAVAELARVAGAVAATQQAVGTSSAEIVAQATVGAATTATAVAAAAASAVPAVTDFKQLTIVRNLEGHTNDVRSIAFSPDGKTLATGSYDHTIILWSVGDWAMQKQLTGPEASVMRIAYSPDGKLLAGGVDNGQVWIWNTADFDATPRVLVHGGRVWSLAFSPDSERLVTGSGDGGNEIKLWRIADGQLLHSTALADKDKSNYTRGMAFAPDGSTFATASEDKIVRLWDPIRGTPAITLTGHTDTAYAVAFSPDSKVLASGSRDKTVKLWSMPNGGALLTLSQHDNSVTWVAFSQDGKMLASTSPDSTIIWGVGDGSPIATLKDPASRTISVGFSPDNRFVITGGGLPDPKTPGGKVTVWGVPPK